ncbi:tape measure protein [Acinetobacter baumannii]|uniref:tape measure protein n=1 Tax=Acinetobacter baumannii TaxID=470 RepID=UPI00295876D1|nr:tape measure protein [Acinetobacter baumannii]WNX54342.1 tape measure protein [Acinetobacter baumannii]
MAQESRLVIVIDAKNAERNARNLGNELDSIERKGDFATKSMDALSVATRQLAGYMAGLVTVSAAISKMDTYTGLQNRLKLVTNNQVELNKATEDTFRIAQKTYSAWDSVLQVYQRFSDNAKTLNLTMDDTARLTETVSKAVAISGASAQAADAALVQFGQALASGTLRGEELNSVMEQTPALAKAIAQGMGITVGELRSVAAEGKITSQEIVKALRNVEKDVDALFTKTDITIGQSLTLLNNEITKFVGESGKGSGAAQVLAGNIQTLAGNLDVLTSAMMVGGAYWLGTYIPAIYASGVAVAAKIKELAAQTVTQYAAIQAERAAAAQQVISTQTVVANTQATLAAIAAEKALEVQRLKSQITEKGRTATLTRMAELKKIEAQVTRELALAEEALAVAQSRSAAAGAASVGIGSRLLGLLGGPVGMGITVASLAAGYLLMRDNGDKANDMLEKQSRYASMAADELMKLEGAQKRAAEDELTKQLSLQNAQLSKSQNEFLLLTQSITDNNKQSAEAYRIWAELKTGVIDVNQAFNRLNQLSFISSDQINQLADSKKKVDENTKAVKQTNSELNQVRTSGANAKAGFNDVSQGAKGAVQDVTELNKKLKDINKSLADRKWDAAFKTTLIKKYGRSVEEADLLLQTYRENQKKGYSGVTVEQDKIIKGIVAQENALEALVNKDKARTKELEKQEKVSKRLIGISGQSGIGTGPHLDVRYGGSMSGQKVSNEHLARLQAGGKPLTSYKISSNYGPRKAPTKGASSFHKGIDFSMPEGTPITTNVAVKDIKTWYDSKGGGYVSEVIFEDGVSLKLLHQSPKMQSKVKGGASKGSDKAAGDIQSQLERQQDLQRSLENEVASEVGRINNNRKARLEDVDKANFSPERTAEIKAEINRRADNDIAIAKQALRTKLEDYKEFQKTEEQLLEESFNRKKFNAAHDLELSKFEQKQAVELLEQQKQQELGLLKLAQEQRLFQARLSLLSETQAMQERYRLEREEILKNTKLSIEERQKLIALSKANQDKETRDKVNNAVQNWGGIQADMNGTSEFFRQDQERFSRLNAANDLADSQFAATDLNEQNSLDGLDAQMEAGLIKQQDYENQKTAIIQAAQDQRNQIAAEHAKNVQDIEDKYQQDRLNTQIAFGGQMMGSLTSMFGSMFGEQSKAYKIMFAADKAYAIAAAGIAIQQNIAAASKAGFPLNLPLIAGAVAQGASIIANIRAIKDQGFAEGGYTGRGGKYEVAGAVHKGEIVWSQEDIKRWGGVGLVEKMRKSSSPEAFLNNNASADSVMRRAMMSSSAFIESQKQADIFNQPVQDTQIIYKGNRDTPKLASSGNSDLFHDGKVYFSSNGLVQDRSNLDDVQDFTLGSTSRPQAEIMPSIEPASPTINFKIEVINQVSGATVEAEQLDEQTVRIIVKDELDKQLPRTVPKLVSDQIANPNSTISRSLTENTTARRNR